MKKISFLNNKNFKDKKREDNNHLFINNNSGFIIADFLFAFVMIIGLGILIFALTFSLATIEIAQYVLWSTARTYASGNLDEGTANEDAKRKFKSLIEQYPMLKGEDNSWFKLDLDTLAVGDLLRSDQDLSAKINFSEDKDNVLRGTRDKRQPWIGASAQLTLKLYSSLRIPFLGTVADGGKDIFTFPIRAFLIRHPSQKECKNFFTLKYAEINKLEPGFGSLNTNATNFAAVEDNGC